MKVVKVSNMTSLFSKEMLIYSFFDIRLKSPLRIVAIFYFILLFILIGIPVFIIAWPPNVYSLMIAIGVPFGGSMLMSRPIWNGKSFMSFAKAQVKYFLRPRVMYDWKSKSKETLYMVDSDIIVSRHDDYRKLYKLTREENVENV